MFCHRCGKEIDDQAVICVHCGVSVGKQSKVVDPTAKSKLVAGLLGILIGSFGIHNFYLGFTSKGIAQVLLSTLGAIVIVGPIIAWVWGLVEGIQILTGTIDRDSDGKLLRD